MDIKSKLISRALKSSATICLPENEDIRIENAAKEMKKIGFDVINCNEFKKNIDEYYDLISRKKFSKNWTKKMKLDFLNSNLNLSLSALESGHVDSVVAGAVHTTPDVLRSCLRIIGLKKNTTSVSSSFFMISPKNDRLFIFSDGGVIPEPTSEQLVEIAYESSITYELLTEDISKIAFLSFSTKGSAQHYKVKKIQKAVEIFGNKYPNITHDGEMQFDAAISNEVSKMKVKNNKLKGESNIFIFPDLDSANIAYKITQYLASYQALGPLLQGLQKPVHDLSRGCSIDDIIYVSAIAMLQAQHN